MPIIWDTSMAEIPITFPLSNTEVRFVGFSSVIIYAWCRGEQLQYWLPVRLNATLVTIFFFFKFAMRKPVKNCLHYIYILLGRDELFGQVVYIYIHNSERARKLSAGEKDNLRPPIPHTTQILVQPISTQFNRFPGLNDPLS